MKYVDKWKIDQQNDWIKNGKLHYIKNDHKKVANIHSKFMMILNGSVKTVTNSQHLKRQGKSFIKPQTICKTKVPRQRWR